MKREGKQHGIVRTCVILPSSSSSATKNAKIESRYIIKQGSSPPTDRLYTKVCTKPTNHSKSNGKCGKIKCSGCHHLHPVFKSKDKNKGTQKTKSGDVALNYKLLTWRVANGGHESGLKKLKLNGYSASKILDDLACDTGLDCSLFYDEDDGVDASGGGDLGYENYQDHDQDDGYGDYDAGYGLSDRIQLLMSGGGSELMDGGDGGEARDGIEEDDGVDLYHHDGNVAAADDEMMGFFDVAFVWEPTEADGEEGWSLVGGI